MICYEEIYGDDIDGNRGIKQLVVEIEPSDSEDVVEALYELFLDGKTGTQTIQLYCSIEDEYIDVEVEIEEYHDELIAFARADKDLSGRELKNLLTEVYIEKIGDRLGKKPTYKDIAKHLGVSEQAVKQYPKTKRDLFKLGLWIKRESERGLGNNENSNTI